MATHLFQKKGESTWYVRRVVPEDVRHAFGGRVTVTRTTGTSNKAKAMERRHAILAEWQGVIDAARAGKASELEDTLDLASQSGISHAAMISGAISDVLTGSGEQSSSLEGVEELAKEISKAASDGHIPNDGAIALLRMLKDAIELREAHTSEVPDAEKIQLLSSFRTSHMKELFRSAVDSEPDLSPATKAQALAVYQSPKAYKPRSPITTARLDSFRVHLERKGTASKTIDQMCKRVALFSGLPIPHRLPDKLRHRIGIPRSAH